MVSEVLKMTIYL